MKRGRPFASIHLIVALYFCLGVLYSVVTPIFEAGDEIWHYPFVQYLATTGQLPVQDPGQRGLWEQEGGQPPLYYALAAASTFWIDTRDLTERLWVNPHAQIGVPLAFGNKNLVVHTSAESFPWQGTTLAVHLIRLLSLLFGGATVWATYALGRELYLPSATLGARIQGWTGERTALLGASLVAVNPMFLFITASVNNDSLAAALGGLSVLLIVQCVTRGASRPRLILTGLALGLGALTKESNLGLILVCGFIVLFLARRGMPRGLERRQAARLWMGQVLQLAWLPALFVLTLAGWWYARNLVLYGDLTGLNVWLAIAGTRPRPIGLLDLIPEFQGFRISFWGNFGGVNIIAPEWVYSLLDVLSALACVGLAVGWLARKLPRLLLIAALWAGMEFILLVRWTLTTYASQGRLLFPALPAVTVLLASGLVSLTAALVILLRGLWPRFPRLATRSVVWLPLSLPAALLGFGVLAPFLLVAPVYALPPRTRSAEVPHPVHIRFGDRAELVGFETAQRSVRPGESLPLTLYWKGLAPMDEDYSVYIHLFDAEGNAVGQWDAWPGNGLYPTRLWQVGELLVDHYRVPVTFDVGGPQAGRIEVGLYRRRGLAALAARDPKGIEITPTLGRFKIAGPAQPADSRPNRATFDAQIGIAAVEVERGPETGVKIAWRALRNLDHDYTAFVHLVDEGGQLLAQADGQPHNGAYPTSLWEAGEIVQDRFVLPASVGSGAGPYHLEIGWYDAGSGARLANEAGGNFYAVPLNGLP